MGELATELNGRIIDIYLANKMLESFKGNWVYIKSVVNTVKEESLEDYISYYNKFRVSKINLGGLYLFTEKKMKIVS